MPGTVTVACKLPNGLILRGFRMIESSQQVMGGGTRMVKEAIDTGMRQVINGIASEHGKPLLDPEGNPINMAQSFALTYNVDADLWDLWLEQNKNSDVVKNGMIFAHAKPIELRAEAKDKRDLRSGLEPMNPQGDPRSPQRTTRLRGGNITVLETAQAPG